MLVSEEAAALILAMFGVYSAEGKPELLYQYGLPAETGSERVEMVAGLGDRPLDLVVDLSTRHVLWTLVGEYRGNEPRAGYFIAEYRAVETETFNEFQQALKSLRYSDEWVLPNAGDLRSNAGFELWRVVGDLPGLTEKQGQRLVDHLRSGGAPLEFRMSGYRQALQAVKAVADENLRCTVAVDGEDRDDIPPDVDLLLRPTGDTDFEPISTAAQELMTPTASPNPKESLPDGGNLTATLFDDTNSVRTVWGLFGALLVGMLALSLYSFVDQRLLHPITGLATIGGFLGAVLGFSGILRLIFDESDDSRTVFAASLTAIQEASPLAVLAVTYGTVLAFAYPTLFRTLGTVAGSPWLFGPITDLPAATVSVVVFVLLVFLMTYVFMALITNQELEPSQISQLAAGHAVYGALILLATGLASSVWYQFITAA